MNRERISVSRTQVLGDNPKEVSDCARRFLEPGYYVSASGRSATRISHFLGSLCRRSPYSTECASSAPRKGPYGFMSPVERSLRLRRRTERSERNWNLALAERQEAWKDRFSVVQVKQLSVLTCSIPSYFLSWCEGRACTNGQNFNPLTSKVSS